MITPTNITNYNRTQAELEEFLLFAILVAGKNSKVQAKKLEEFLFNARVIKASPFKWLEYLATFNDRALLDNMKAHKLGQYKRLEKTFRGILIFKDRLYSVSLEDLEIHVGPKTARFFLLHSRPNQRVAALDTHILKYMSEKGYNVPKSTPSKKKYRKIELDFLAECDKAGKNVADMDLEIWKSYSK